ncbi:MAG: alpha/beta hydrolase [Treponema sp.]|nr:alpha/beta hydrolase [Treponema sp.]
MTNLFYKYIAQKTRKAWKSSDDKRDADFSIPDSVEVIKDISYGPYGKWNLLDINRPKNMTEKLPCIISFHGGGFFYGTKETYKYYTSDLAARGFAVINFNYRLAPEHKFPCQIEDCNAVVKWLESNGESYNIDTNKVFFVGDSAGANLVYTYSAILTNIAYASLYDFSLPKIKPKGVALNCGVYEFDDAKRDPLRKAYVGNFKKYAEHMNVKKYITAYYPPVFIMSAPNDFLLYQLQPMADFFTSKNVPVTAKVYGTKEDPKACHVFHCNQSLPYAKQCNDDECNFFMTRT